VDHAVAEIEKARHIPLAVFVVQRDERQVAARCLGVVKASGRLHLMACTRQVELLIAASVQLECCAGPRPCDECEGLATNDTGRPTNADAHQTRVAGFSRPSHMILGPQIRWTAGRRVCGALRSLRLHVASWQVLTGSVRLLPLMTRDLEQSDPF